MHLYEIQFFLNQLALVTKHAMLELPNAQGSTSCI